VTKDAGPRREVPKIAVIGAFIVLAFVIGGGVFYILNDGWKTSSQKEWDWLHVTLPLKLAASGDKSMLKDENARRKAHGEALLVEPPDTRRRTDADYQASRDVLQKALQAHQPQGGGTR